MNDLHVLSHLKLCLHIDTPDLEDCYCEGYEVALDGGLEEANPYVLNSVEYTHWLDGWWDGFYEQPPAFNMHTNESIQSDSSIVAVPSAHFTENTIPDTTSLEGMEWTVVRLWGILYFMCNQRAQSVYTSR